MTLGQMKVKIQEDNAEVEKDLTPEFCFEQAALSLIVEDVETAIQWRQLAETLKTYT